MDIVPDNRNIEEQSLQDMLQAIDSTELGKKLVSQRTIQARHHQGVTQ